MICRLVPTTQIIKGGFWAWCTWQVWISLSCQATAQHRHPAMSPCSQLLSQAPDHHASSSPHAPAAAAVISVMFCYPAAGVLYGGHQADQRAALNVGGMPYVQRAGWQAHPIHPADAVWNVVDCPAARARGTAPQPPHMIVRLAYAPHCESYCVPSYSGCSRHSMLRCRASIIDILCRWCYCCGRCRCC